MILLNRRSARRHDHVARCDEDNKGVCLENIAVKDTEAKVYHRARFEAPSTAFNRYRLRRRAKILLRAAIRLEIEAEQARTRAAQQRTRKRLRYHLARAKRLLTPFIDWDAPPYTPEGLILREHLNAVKRAANLIGGMR